jgi:threonylcarbamoyladenosine tRNA methylthiotransferase MtaB
MQSGSDEVLARMQRWHTRDMYRARVLEVAARVPVLGLGADVIAGFPGETSDDHQDTLSLIEELPFTYLHVFPFSPRMRTAAAEMPDQVTQRIAGHRSRELRELGVEKGGAHRARRVGGWADVIPEGDGGRGLTGDYLRVEVRANGSAPEGTFRRARLQGESDHLCIDLTRPSERIR